MGVDTVHPAAIAVMSGGKRKGKERKRKAKAKDNATAVKEGNW